MKNLLFLLTLTLFSGCLDVGSPEVVIRDLESKIIHLEGDVRVFDAQAVLNQQIPEGALIRTGADGYAEIRIGKENVISLRPDTDLIWGLHLQIPSLELKAGTLSAVLMDLPARESGERLQVRTPATVAGIRGTSFFIQVENPDNTYFCLCNGHIHLDSPEGGIPEEMEATEHAARWFVRRDGVVGSQEGQLVYHDSDQMQALAGTIQQEIDWSSPHVMK